MSEALKPLVDAKVVDSKVDDVADRYTVGDMLGEGRFSQVFAASRGKTQVALKAVDMATLEEDEEAVEALVQEVTALRRAYAASKGHVPKVHEVLQTADTVYVVMDQVRGCELFEMLEQGPLSESSARRLIAQLLSALCSLHKHHVVHRDVKPENLMVCDVDDPAKCRLVMIDFGYAAIGSSSSSSEALEGLAGSPEYAAPEVLTWLDGDGETYDRSCDMWSVGVTAYVLLCGELPYDFPDESNLAGHVKTAPIKFTQPCWTVPVLDGDEGEAKAMILAQEFVKACMRVDPAARLTAKQALQHPWFAPRPDDHKSVTIGASKSAFAALERRVSTITATDAPKRVIRWFGRLAGRKRAAEPTKQMFWELKLGMPPTAQEQEGKGEGEGGTSSMESSPVGPPSSARLKPPAAGAPSPLALSSSTANRAGGPLPGQPGFNLKLQQGAGAGPPPGSPLVVRPLTALNVPAPEFLASARKAIALDSDRAEEAAIKKATPRAGGLRKVAVDAENPMPSPRRALFLAPSPRSSTEQLEGAMARPASRPITPEQMEV